jgi:non-ribosomal peptide synthetase component F
VFCINSSDIVYQGFSVSFDMWLEETWIAYLTGASLWISDETDSKSFDELGKILRRENITVLHAVPSLLAVIDNEVPSLRIINAGGEACKEEIS